jgi:hypothetical protein
LFGQLLHSFLILISFPRLDPQPSNLSLTRYSILILNLLWNKSFSHTAAVVVIATSPRPSAIRSCHHLSGQLFGLAAIFYLPLAPLAAVRGYHHAGAIMVLFLFVIMMLDLTRKVKRPAFRDWWWYCC